MENKIYVVGIGPGHRDYITPAAMNALSKSDVIIGSKRHIDGLDFLKSEFFEMASPFKETIEFIKNNLNNKKIAIVVSGDPGFYSFLNLLKKDFASDELSVIPGISSMQYFFSKLSMDWKDASLISLHGRDLDIVEMMKKSKKLFLLTDKINSYREIASVLIENNMADLDMYIGSDLSYENEKIYCLKASEALNLELKSDLIVVIIYNEEN